MSSIKLKEPISVDIGDIGDWSDVSETKSVVNNNKFINIDKSIIYIPLSNSYQDDIFTIDGKSYISIDQYMSINMENNKNMKYSMIKAIVYKFINVNQR
jgi:hypothetical protein